MEIATFNHDPERVLLPVSAFWGKSTDDIRLRFALWNVQNSTKGTVFLFPGRTEYLEKLGRTATELNRLGFVCLGVDWRGQGLSDRLTPNRITSHVNRFSDYQKDVEVMVSMANDLDLPKPWFLLGHSMGACIGLRSIYEGFPAKACAFTAPLWNIHFSPIERPAAWALTFVAQALGAGHKFAPGNKLQEDQCYVLSVDYEGNRLTNDPEMFKFMVDQAKALPDQQTGAPSLGWVYAALKECYALSKLSAPEIPCVTFLGDHDVVVDKDSVVRRMDCWPQGSIDMIADCKHDILLEKPNIRNRVLENISSFFSK